VFEPCLANVLEIGKLGKASLEHENNIKKEKLMNIEMRQ